MFNRIIPLLTVFLLCYASLRVLAQDNSYFLGEDDFYPEEEGVNFISEDTTIKLQPKIDLSDWFPPAGNQANKGSCWAWATTYSYRSFMDKNLEPVSLKMVNIEVDHEKIFSPEYTYQYYKNKRGCKAGNRSYQVLEKILRDGAVFFSDFPYQEQCDINIPDSIEGKKIIHVLPGRKVELIHDVYSMKKVLSNNIPLILSIKVDDNLGKIGREWAETREGIPIWDNFRNYRGSHAMVVVGYDDSLGAFKVLNSWGYDWGDKGHIWISYNIIDQKMNYSCYPKNIEVEEDLAREIIPKQLTKNTKSSSTSSSLTTWVKEGYYRKFDNLRVVLSEVDPKKNFAVIQIKDGTELKNSFYFEKGQTNTFYINGEEYNMKFNNISKAGSTLNFLNKKALYFSINKTEKK